MPGRKAFSIVAALACAAVLFVPVGSFARGGGGFAARGPVFGFHPRVAAHRAFRHAHVHRVPARFGWQLRWWNARHRDGAGAGAIYPGYGRGTGLSDPGDVTGGIGPGPAVFVPPPVPPAPSERIGCFSRGYDVPAESRGGVAHVVVIRC
jgi:hypothetical protein